MYMQLRTQREMYFSTIETCLKISSVSGSNPAMTHVRWQSVVFIINLIVMAICLTVTSVGLILNKNNTTREIIGSFESILTFIYLTLKVSCAFQKRSSIYSLIKSTLAFWNPEDLTCESDKRELLTILKYVKYASHALVMSTTIIVTGYIVRPFLSKKKILVLEGYVPEDPIFYKLMFYVESHTMIVFSSGVAAFDILFLTFIILPFAQIKMFNKGINRLLSMDITSPEERVTAKQTMRKYIQYHIYLLNFLKKVVDTYSTLLLQVILFWMFANCVEMFNITRTTSLSDAMSYLSYIADLNLEVIVFYCIPCQLLTNEIENTRACIVNSDWNKNFMLFKTEILMVLAVSNKSKVIVAGKFIEFSMSMFISVGRQILTALEKFYIFTKAFKTMISYYTFVVNVTQK